MKFDSVLKQVEYPESVFEKDLFYEGTELQFTDSVQTL